MKRARRRFTAKFNAQVVIVVIKGQETLSQLPERFKVSNVMISKWKSLGFDS